jgi:F-type H+-transporting ATPase subunit gamma
MKAATDNAEDRSRPQRVMNRARQDAITTEIMEIVSGASLRQAAAAGGPAARRPSATICWRNR